MNGANMLAEVQRLLAQARHASESADAQEPPARPLPALTAEQIAATDEMAGLCDEVTA